MKRRVSMAMAPVHGVFREVCDDCKGRQMDSLWGLPLSSCGPFLRKPLLKCTCVCLCLGGGAGSLYAFSAMELF